MIRLSKPKAKQEIGVAGLNTRTGDIRADEFLTELKGKRGIKKYQEMLDNSAIIGAIMYALQQTLRDVKIKIEGEDEAGEKFLREVLEDMDHTLDDHVAEAISYLGYGFSWFETVYKKRVGDTDDPKTNSKFTDGLIGIKKIACRAPWTVQEFEVDEMSSEVLGIKQDNYWGKPAIYIPCNKSVYYRTTTLNNDPSGRSILRNAYQSYTYLKRIQELEAIAVEREWNGIPIARLPSEYLASDASAEQIAVRQQMEKILRDVKMNEQGYVLIPSDRYRDSEGKPYDMYLVELELMTAKGTRAIDTDRVIKRYEHDIARSILAEFIMLGSTGTGSYALSKTKTDLFLRSMESYINYIVDTLNKQLVEPLWKLNGMDLATMPKFVAGDVAPHDLKEIAAFLRNLNGAEISIADDPEAVGALMEIAELPFDKDGYMTRREEQKKIEEEQRTLEAEAMSQPNGGPKNIGTNVPR
jgi:hypothetical protein